MFTRLSTPSLGGATQWLNTEPLGLAELRGHVVLVNFCTLTCINWLRTVPYVRAWANAYRDVGLVVIGVHTPEFSFERDTDLVRAALEERRIDYPVAVDNDYEIWRAFHNRYWPALYFLDAEGAVRDRHFGEGRVRAVPSEPSSGCSAPPVTSCPSRARAWKRRQTGTTCAQPRPTSGTDEAPAPGRVRSGTGPASTTAASPGEQPLGTWTADGRSPPKASGSSEPDGSIAFRFHARDAHLVLSPGSQRPAPFRVQVDGQPPGSSRGVDIDEDGNGVLTDGRLYQLVRTHGPVHERTLLITFREPGVAAYAFTFG